MADLQEYKCPCCGGAIAFDATIQKMKCPYCDTEFELEALKSYDEVLAAASEESQMEWESSSQEWQEGETEGMRVYVCKSCGGSIIGDENTAATSCPYCGNPIVMMGQFSGDLKPDIVIPFKLTKEQAMEAYSRHISGKKLLPKIFKDENKIKELQGVYVPFWLFDAEAQAQMMYKATTSRVYQDQQFNYHDTNYYSVARAGSLKFNDVPVDGSQKMDDTLMQSLEPFNIKEAVPFQTAYLAGYVADKYDVTKEQCIETANERIKQSTRQYIASTVSGYESVQQEAENIRLNGGKVEYALYPVWMLSTNYEDQNYTFAMNGQTGKFVGDLPVDQGAYKKQVGLTFTGVFAVAFLLAWLFTGYITLGTILISAVIGLIGALISGSAAKASMKSVRQQTQANNYFSGSESALTLSTDTFLYRRTERSQRADIQGGAPGGTIPGMGMQGQMSHAQTTNQNNNLYAGRVTTPGMNARVQPPVNRPVSQVRPSGTTSGVSRPTTTARPSATVSRPTSTMSRPTATRPSSTVSRPTSTMSRPTTSRPTTSRPGSSMGSRTSGKSVGSKSSGIKR